MVMLVFAKYVRIKHHPGLANTVLHHLRQFAAPPGVKTPLTAAPGYWRLQRLELECRRFVQQQSAHVGAFSFRLKFCMCSKGMRSLFHYVVGCTFKNYFYEPPYTGHSGQIMQLGGQYD